MSYKCSLNLSFSCSLSPECFWVFTFSTTRFLMYESGCSEESDFLEKITSWACLVGSGLEIVFQCETDLRIFLKSLFSIFVDFIERYHHQIVSNSLTLLFKLFVWSLIYIMKNNDPKIEPCGTPVRIVSQFDV